MAFQNTVEACFKSGTKSFEELICLVIGWDPNRPHFMDKNYLFGSMGGRKYISQEFSVNFEPFFRQTKCYLLPAIGVDVSAEVLSFSQISFDFIKEFSQLIKNKLLNIDEIQVKKGEQNNVTTHQMVALFRETVNRLNEDMSDCSQGSQIIQMVDQLDQTIHICPEKQDFIYRNQEFYTSDESNDEELTAKTNKRERSVSNRVIRVNCHYNTRR